MTRVSSFGQNQVMMHTMLQNQSRVFETQEKLISGKNAKDFRGLTGTAATLVTAKSFQSRTEGYSDGLKTVKGRIDANDVQIGGILDRARDFRQSLVTIMAQEEALAFDDVLNETFNFITDALNTNFGGSFIFGGSKSDTPPVDATSISDLTGAANSDDLFVHDDRRQKARVSDNVSMEYGVTAKDIAKDLFTTLKTIADYNAGGSGPFNGKLTQAQKTFLTTEIANLDSAIETTQSVQTRNGLRFQRLETIESQHEDTKVFLQTFISDIEDTNMAEAVTQLEMNQLTLEASFRTMSSISRQTLLDFL